MRFSRDFFILACAAIMALPSCITVDKRLGEDYIPTDQKLQMGTVTLPLPIRQMTMDSLQARSSNSFILGRIKTEELGTADFSFAADVYPSLAGVNFGKDAVVTKAYLSIALLSSHIIDPQEKKIMQEVEVFRLKEPLDTDMIYSNSYSDQLFYDPVPINTQSVEIFGNDSINTYISNDYAQELIVATQRELDTLEYFARSHRGLYFRVKPNAYDPVGGRVNLFDFTNATLYVWINFQPTWGENLNKKDTIITYNIGYLNALNISTYSSQGLKSAEGESPREEIIFEGIGGVKPYITMKDLRQTLDNWIVSSGLDREKLVIAKATINLPFKREALLAGEDLTYPSSLFPANRFLDTTDNKVYYAPLKDVNTSGNTYGAMNRSLAQYTGDVSSFIHKVIHKDLAELESKGDEYNIWFNPVTTQSDYWGNVTYVLDNEYYYFGKINGPASSNPPTLTILYALHN